MTFLRALAYFAREAATNMVRGWRVSVLAVVTIAVSLFVGGVFLVVSGNLATVVAGWRREARLVVYLRPDAADAATRAALAAVVEAPPWVSGVVEVDSAAARQRFREVFPTMADLVEGWSEDPLPASYEIAYDPARVAAAEVAAYAAALRARPEVSMVDDDREWLRQLEAVIAVVRGVGLTLGAVLLGAAVFTIASIIRLTAYLYGEEIAILRLVGGTEFFIRGPFYLEGVLQGLAGGLIAAAALFAAHALVRARAASSLVAWVLAGRFLPWPQVAALVGLGLAAGLLGAVLSLRREKLAAVGGE